MLSRKAAMNPRDEAGNSGVELRFLASLGEAQVLVDGRALRDLSLTIADANSVLEEQWVRLKRWSEGGSACPLGHRAAVGRPALGVRPRVPPLPTPGSVRGCGPESHAPPGGPLVPRSIHESSWSGTRGTAWGRARKLPCSSRDEA